MNQFNQLHHSNEAEALVSRFALRVTARLSERADQTSHDVTERLRFAREQALQRAAAARLKTEAVAAPAGLAISMGNTLAFQGGPADPERMSWGFKFASVLPLVALVAGLFFIQHGHASAQIAAAAEIDTALLSDDLPPAAYNDPGFAEYLRTPGQ
ncbi:MAG: hypothetical protein JWP52_4025 [Rhizobacter sp.]|nr:hypothetical protein [Rhizobacter sp.]